jgi:CheY-like chemotaxis protein
LEHTIDKRIQLKTDLSSDCLKVQGDPTLLQNAFLNLGLNARDAMPNGGTLTFETSRQLIEITRTGISAALSHGDYARIVVSDTGEGMSEETRKRIFEPFFTTKEQGNGMGLAAVYGAVESHRGDITVRSKANVGTSFSLLLPLSASSQESMSFKASKKTARFEGLRVLVAEDEEDVATSTVALLEEMGCDVTLCRDGRSAFDAFQEAPSAYDLVLVDHMMPRLSGRDALRLMRQLKPDLCSVITSGFSNDAVVEGTDESALFLPKPFGQEQLSQIIVRALSSNEAGWDSRSEAPGV